jgi:hypothetical protein
LQPRLGGRLKVLPKLFRANEAGADTFALHQTSEHTRRTSRL